MNAALIHGRVGPRFERVREAFAANFAKYDVWYGAFGSAVVLLLWFYLAVISLVVGGFVNAELERHSGAPSPDRSMY